MHCKPISQQVSLEMTLDGVTSMLWGHGGRLQAKSRQLAPEHDWSVCKLPEVLPLPQCRLLDL